MNILSKEEFRAKVLADQAVRKRRQFATKSALPFKNEVLYNVKKVVQSLFEKASLSGESPLDVYINDSHYTVAVIEKKKKPTLTPATHKDKVKSQMFAEICECYEDLGSEPILIKEGLAIPKGGIVYVVKITKKKI